MKILVLDTVHPVLMEMLQAAGHHCTDASLWGDAEVLAQLGDAEGLVLRSRMPIDMRLIDCCSRLKFIGRVGAGLEHVDQAYAKSRGIDVISSPEGNRQAVAEHALGMLLAMFSNIVKADREVRQGMWLRKENEGEELEGKTVAIIGYGNTGSALARVLSGFETELLAYDKYKSGFGSERVHECTMDDIFRKADVVSIHLPMSSDTHRLVSRAWIDRFDKPFYLVNTARGGIVNTTDVLDALDDGRMRGACLDVLEFETETLKMPPLDALPVTVKRLMNHPRVLLSPHVAGLTVQSYEKLSRILAEKIIARFGHA